MTRRMQGTLVIVAIMIPVATINTGCPPPGPPMAFLNADVERGGALYDNWWVVAGAIEPTEDHPLWASRPDMLSNTRTGSDTWRCKECHGWDYKGVNGAYATGSHRTGFFGIQGASDVTLRSKAVQDLFDILKTNHSLGSMTDLTDADIWDLVKFVAEGQLNSDDIIDPMRAFIGTVATGQTIYDANCAVCHGADGLSIPPGGAMGFDDFVGALSNANPEEFQHKVSFGQPGTAMPLLANELTVTEIGNLGAYAQTLPITP